MPQVAIFFGYKILNLLPFTDRAFSLIAASTYQFAKLKLYFSAANIFTNITKQKADKMLSEFICLKPDSGYLLCDKKRR